MNMFKEHKEDMNDRISTKEHYQFIEIRETILDTKIALDKERISQEKPN